MRISDWSSDVCSSDLDRFRFPGPHVAAHRHRLDGAWPGNPPALAGEEERVAHGRAPAGCLCGVRRFRGLGGLCLRRHDLLADKRLYRSEEHTSELQSLMRISYAVFCLKKKKHNTPNIT